MRAESEEVVAVSACLLGEPCRFDGRDAARSQVREACEGREVVAVCPEVLGGLGTPRNPVQFRTGDGHDALRTRAGVVDDLGMDRTDALIAGARLALQRVLETGASRVILKERSPSCGGHRVHRADEGVAGAGVFTALLIRHDVKVVSDEEVS